MNSLDSLIKSLEAEHFHKRQDVYHSRNGRSHMKAVESSVRPLLHESTLPCDVIFKHEISRLLRLLHLREQTELVGEAPQEDFGRIATSHSSSQSSFEEMLIDMYSTFDDDVLFALTNLLNDFTDKKDGDRSSFPARCVEILGSTHIELVIFVLENPGRVLFSLITDFLRLDIHNQNAIEKAHRSRPTVYFSDANRRSSREDKYMVKLLEKGRRLQSKEDAKTLFTKGLVESGASVPVGSQLRRFHKHAQLDVPASAPTHAGKDSLINVHETLPPWSHAAFGSITELNPVQSKIFPIAFHSDENMLISAPTGCGKTLIAMLVILRLIQKSREVTDAPLDGTSPIKVTYLVPMKALAAEVVANFQRRFRSLNIVVREYTGDMSLTRQEIDKCNIIVSTPEKWDIITRKIADNTVLDDFQLMIIDEIHLLNEDRGPVIEAIVARILMKQDISGNAPRIVGLSATLPNARDVASFIRADPDKGFMTFGDGYRPVPLHKTYMGVKDKLPYDEKPKAYNAILYESVIKALAQGKQVMIFVQARNRTMVIAKHIREQMTTRGNHELFQGSPLDTETQKKIRRLKSRDLVDLISDRIGIHHAGMLRPDRSLVEDLFKARDMQVLVCTATLAWGVNLPAHTVIIHGTEIYDSKQGGFVHLSPLDVLQIFGRAGRPGFDTSGHGIIITGEAQVQHYVRMLSHSANIESHMQKELANHLNAEINAASVASVNDGMKWMEYTYLWQRVRMNPFAYGITAQHFRKDRNLYQFRCETITAAAEKLHAAQMARYDPKTCSLHPTEIGRIASHYYIGCESIVIFNDLMTSAKGDSVQLTDDEDILRVIASCRDFEQLRVRPEEEEEIQRLEKKLPFTLRCKRHSESLSSSQTKVMSLLKFYFARLSVQIHSLVSDTLYIIDNVQRVCRALFEMEVYRQHPESALKFLDFAKCVAQRCWVSTDHPIWQFQGEIPPYLIDRIEERMPLMDELMQMSGNEIGDILQNKAYGHTLKKLLAHFPRVDLRVKVQPMTRKVLRVQVKMSPMYSWSEKYHGTNDVWWLVVKDRDGNVLLHNEYVSFTKSKVSHRVALEANFTIPLIDDYESYEVVVDNTTWIGARENWSFNLHDFDIPDDANHTTKVLPLVPLSVNVVSRRFHAIYPYSFFNTVQTHCFHALYHTDENVFLGAPTGSGKTVCAEFAMLRVLQRMAGEPGAGKIVYIAPLKALVRERITDWRQRFQHQLKISVVELTGDLTPSAHELSKGTILCTTPEKWDGISRSWKQRKFVRDVALVIIDEVHMLNSERGPTLEMIASRTKIIGWAANAQTRLVALSTAVANSGDMALWLGVQRQWAQFNFEPSVRPVPMKCFISGFPGRAYCPRMATMNKPIYAAIAEKSPVKPVIVFVSSRRQTRLTALALINMLLTDEQPDRFARMDSEESALIVKELDDTYLQYVLPFGIGIHHGGLCESDRFCVEKLFKAGKLQILVATSTLAWGVNFPAHMVVVKGTEFFDCKLRTYVDFPITDVLQMIGRAGRPQYDTEGIALVLTQDTKKEFYKRFLYNSFPVESFLHNTFITHINAEIANKTIQSCSDMVDFFTWTFLFRRIIKNPLFYGIPDTSNQAVSAFLSDLVHLAVSELKYCFCLEADLLGDTSLQGTQFGRLCAYYYLSHQTMRRFVLDLNEKSSPEDVLRILSRSEEFAELPVRHNEDNFNVELAKLVPIAVDGTTIDSPHTKAHLLLQAHFERCPLPISDYKTDTRSVIENSARIVQGLIDVAACQGFLLTVIHVAIVWKAISTRRWWRDHTLLQIPHCEPEMLPTLASQSIVHIRDLVPLSNRKRESLSTIFNDYKRSQSETEEAISVLENLPMLSVSLTIERSKSHRLLVSVHRDKRGKPSSHHQNTVQFIAIIGDLRCNELIALKHIHRIRDKVRFELSFDWDESWEPFCTPDAEGSPVYPLQFQLICGSYFGLDFTQNFSVKYKNVQ